MIVPWHRGERFDQIVDRQHDGRIADGMDTELPALLVGHEDEIDQLGLGHVQLAPILVLAFVGLAGVRRGASEAAVDEYLQRADSQVLVAISGALPVCGQCCRFLDKQLHRCAGQGSAVLCVSRFPHLVHIRRCLCVCNGGDAVREQRLQVVDQARAQILQWRFGNQVADDVLPFPDHAVQGAGFVPFDDPAVWIGRGGVHAADLQSGARENRAVPAGASQHHRVPGCGGVQVTDQRATPLGELIL